MNVLVDTSVWSLALRRRPSDLNSAERQTVAQLTELITANTAQTIGPVRQELLTGIKSTRQFEALRETLRSFQDVLLETADFEEAALCFNACRSKGIEPSDIDILICAAALRRQMLVFTLDKTMQRCCAILGAQLR